MWCRCFFGWSGKSTLLDVLTGRKTGGRMSGSILVNGVPKDQQSFSNYAAYIEQFDRSLTRRDACRSEPEPLLSRAQSIRVPLCMCSQS